MDRIYVKHQGKAPVTQLGLDLWRDCVVRRRGVRERMLGLLLDLVQRERGHEIVDRALLRSITTVRCCLGCGFSLVKNCPGEVCAACGLIRLAPKAALLSPCCAPSPRCGRCIGILPVAAWLGWPGWLQ
jgi:hypothetical protein